MAVRASHSGAAPLVTTLLTAAIAAALSGPADRRTQRIGAVAIRGDGTLVRARNGPATDVTPGCHAEARLARKLDRGAVVLVARVKRRGGLGLAMPCRACLAALRARRVSLVWYTTGIADAPLARLYL